VLADKEKLIFTSRAPFIIIIFRKLINLVDIFFSFNGNEAENI
jgi:hypothetical protein